MAYLASIHKPSSIRHALKLNFFTNDEECLVVAKANTLEFYRLTEDGLILRHVKSIFARVTMLEKLRPVSAATDHLFVGTSRHSYFTISWNAQKHRIQTEKQHVDLVLQGSRDTNNGEKCTVDPKRRLMVLEVFEGVFNIVPIIEESNSRKRDDVGNLGDPITCRIPQFFIRSRAFLHGTTAPRMVLLWVDAARELRPLAKEFQYPPDSDADTIKFKDVSLGPKKYDWRGARVLIPLPEPARGVLVLCDTKMVYIDHGDRIAKEKALPVTTAFVTWISLSTTTYLVADDYGQLHLLEITVRDGSLQDLTIAATGTVSKPTCLVRMTEDRIFVGSHQGDAQLIRLDLSKRSIEILQTLPNIAPIVDFTIMDLGSRAGEAQMNEFSSGQARIVTGSGAFQDGSLRSVRSGVGLEEQATLAEIEGIQNLFSVRLGSGAMSVDTILVSLLDETRAFHFNEEGDVEELDQIPGMSMTETTLVATNLGGSNLIQVTPSSVRLIKIEQGSGTVIAHWTPPDNLSITDASASASPGSEALLLAVGGVRLVVLDVQHRLEVVAETSLGDDRQIACVHVPSGQDKIGIVGAWQGATVSIVHLKTLQVLHSETLAATGEASVPRSLMLVELFEGQPPILLVAMADGTVLTFSMDPSTYELRSKKRIVLGTREAKFYELPRSGPPSVFASCDHPTLIYGSDGSIVYSAVTTEEATCVCPFDSDVYQEGFAVATSKELKIALIDEQRRTHVQDLHLGETARRLAYSPTLRTFAVGTIRRTVENGAEGVQSYVKLVDEVLFDLLATYELNRDEMVESVIRAEMKDEHGESVERFIVGTGYVRLGRRESIRGRILVFEVDEHRTLQVLTELEVKGACRCLGTVQGKIAAGLVKTIVIYALEYNGTRASLVKRAAYRTATAPIDLTVVGSEVAVGDIMKSVSVFEYRVGENGLPDSLEEIARRYQVAWTTAVAHVAEDTFLESTSEGNLNVLHMNRHGVTPEDRRQMEVTSEMNLGESVNRIRRINVPVSSNVVVIPRAFLATTDGSLYLFALISPRRQDLLMQLQSRMADRVDNPGKLSFNKYRAPRSALRVENEPFRFVDGDLIERFVDFTETVQEDLVEGLGVDVEEVRTMVDGLRRLR